MHFTPLRRRVLQAFAALPLCLARTAPRAAAETRAPRFAGYLPWWMAAGWKDAQWSRLDRLLLFDAPVQEDGSVLDRGWLQRAPGLAAGAARAGIPLDLTLTLLEQRQFDAVFAEPARRNRLLEEATRLLELPFVAGLHLDIEGYSAARPPAIAGFRQWLQVLDERRRNAGKGLSAFFPASESFAPYDRDAAQRVDYWVAQLYDAHWRGSAVTGPLVTRAQDNAAAVPRALARLHALGVARRAILLSVPLYGWEWPSRSDRRGAATRGAARLLTYAETPPTLMPNDRLAASELARQHGLRRDAEHTPYYAYRNGAGWVQGWFEDAASLTTKLAPERTQGYAGLAFFALGYDRGEIVDAMLRWWREPQR